LHAGKGFANTSVAYSFDGIIHRNSTNIASFPPNKDHDKLIALHKDHTVFVLITVKGNYKRPLPQNRFLMGFNVMDTIRTSKERMWMRISYEAYASDGHGGDAAKAAQ
jgi:hypothetical protein